MNEKKPVVCVVDPDDQHKAMLRSELERRGYEVRGFSDGSKVLQFLIGDGAKITPSFIVMDVISPNISGFEATRRLGEHRKTASIPIMLMADHCGPEDVIEAQGVGAAGCLKKPVTADMLEVELAERKARADKQAENLAGKFKVGFN